MNTRFLLLPVLAFLLLSCMEDYTIIYDQALAESEVAAPPKEDKTSTTNTHTTHTAAVWIGHMQLENGLVESAEFTDFVSLYDNALAALVFLSEGEIERAERIFDYFDARLETEFLKNGGGFFQFRDTRGENGNRIWMGDNAWLLLALNNYHEITRSTKYGQMASELNSWLRSLQEEDGGLRGGINEDGTQINKVTEGIITAFNAVKGYDAFHEGILRFLQEQRWDGNEQVLITKTENPAYHHELDLYTLGSLILEDFPTEVLYKADRFLNTQTSTSSGLSISGYCFDDDKDVVWLEGTAQMALAFESAGLTTSSATIIQTLEATFINSAAAQGASGIPYTTNFGTTFGASFLWDHADIAPTISSSAWYLFLKNDFNPFSLELTKGIPLESQFWNAGA